LGLLSLLITGTAALAIWRLSEYKSGRNDKQTQK